MTDVTTRKPRPRNYECICAVCSTPFKGYSSVARCCSEECKRTFRTGYMKEYHEARPGYQQELSRAYYAANSEALRARTAAYYAANTERARETQKAYVAANRDKVRASGRAWAKANPDAVKASQRASKRRMTPAQHSNSYHLRKARKAGNGVFLVTERDMRRSVARNNNACAYCAAPFGVENPITWDHVVAIARGGTHSIGNLLPCCGVCNCSKWASTLTEWRMRTSRYKDEAILT